jgi:LTXXQ motif family protein
VFAYEAQARKTSDETADLKRAAKGAAELQKSLQQERERADRLEQELAAARRDVETQTALAKADEKAARERQVAESESAELRKSLQQERGRVARLKRQLAFARSAKAAPAAPAVVATRFTPDKIREAEATGPQATTVAEARDGTRRGPAVRNARAAMGTTAAVGASALAAKHANVARNASAVQRSLSARPVSRALNNTVALRDPRNRAFITAHVATAAWHGGNWWWRHRNGGFGWVGPLFWPFAFYDISDYAFWGYPYDDAFWGYGYPDLYAVIFGLYGYDDLMGYAGYLPRYAGRRGGNLDTYAYAPSKGRTSLAQMCGDDSRVIAGLPIKAFQNAIQPNEAQRAALEVLANASEKAAAGLKGSCPTDVALTAPGRLAAMQQRIEAMTVAVETVQGPLDKFYGLLSDEQKAQINALSTTGRRPARTAARAGSTGPACDVTQPELIEWPTATIEQSVRPTDQQRPYLDALQGAAAQAAETLKASCQTRPEDAQTPPARLAAVAQRLNAMLQAVETVRMRMHDFYGSLTGEQKAAFERSVRSRLVGADTSAGAHSPADDVVCAVTPQARSCF